MAELEAAFHATHERVFAVSEPGQRVECLTWKGRASVRLPKPGAAKPPLNGAVTIRTNSYRSTWWGSDDEHDAPIHAGDSLHRGETITGPAIVELPTTTIVVYPRWRLEVNERGDFVLLRQAPTPIAAEEAA